MSDDLADEDWADYESAPYCRHWRDPWDCEILCKCGHPCSEHPDDKCLHREHCGDAKCNQSHRCECEEWSEADD